LEEVSEKMDSESEAEEFEEQAIQDIKEGKLKVLNSDGTFRCPSSPNKKKQSYKFSEFLQHAERIQKGKQGMEAAGKHQALLRHLKEDHKERAKLSGSSTLIRPSQAELRSPGLLSHIPPHSAIQALAFLPHLLTHFSCTPHI
jgi:hypothetical protein